MKLKEIKYTPTFLKQLRSIPKSQTILFDKKLPLLMANPFTPSLKTHKLKGDLVIFYSFSISYHWRIVFHFENEETIVLDRIGTHQIYR